MKDYLLFRLHGAMASWGEIAVGEHRPSASYPSRSAILGLLAAAKGIRRDSEELLQRLAASYGLAVATDAVGTPLRDYHTAQVPPQQRGAVHRTRRDELAAGRLNTILSSRDYHTDVLHRICLWQVEEAEAPFTLSELAEALERPVFTLYLGRKSCPLSLPLQPQVLSAESIQAAFAAAEFNDELIAPGLRLDEWTSYRWDDSSHAGMQPSKTFTRRDQPHSRSRWQFVDRQEHFRTERRKGG